MKEDVLQYCWQFQKYSTQNLKTVQGQSIHVIKTGVQNAFDGPDFLNAHVQIDGIDWFGHVEIHDKASDWNSHGHSENSKYASVILHVVHEDDIRVSYEKGTEIPVLDTRALLPEEIIKKSSVLLENKQGGIPCGSSLQKVPVLIRNMQLDRSLVFRYQKKAEDLREVFLSKERDVLETLHALFLRSLGFSKNAEGMLRLSDVVPYKLLKKHAGQPDEIRLLLFGGAGLLSSQSDLSRFDLLAHKYGLRSKVMRPSEWIHGAVRPANFPEVRLGQFVTFLAEVGDLLSVLSSEFDFSDWMNGNKNYGFSTNVRKLLLINCIIPFHFFIASLEGKEEDIVGVLDLLDQLTPEDNTVTRSLESVGFLNDSARDSQALLGQKKYFCDQNKCLKCQIGVSLVG